MRAPRHETPATARLQRAFLDDLTGRRLRSDVERETVFLRPRRGTVADRWHVYAHGYVARLVEALELEFAAVRRILGTEAFAALVARYTSVFPPRSFDLADAGERLARFLEFDALSAELPFLTDLAQLERSVARCFTAAEATAVTWGELQERAPEEVAALRLGLAPGVIVMRSAWPLADLWKSRLEPNDGAIAIPLEDRPSRVLVSRREGRVRVEEVSEIQAALVEAAGSGDVTPEDLQALSGTPEDTASVGRLLDGFRGLVEKGVFVHKRSTGWTGALEIPKEDLP